MTDMRTVSSTTTNHTNNSNTSASSDPNDLSGLTTYINTVFRQMEEKFMAASDQVMNRMNELGKRIDTLETSIGDIIAHLPTEQQSTTSSSSLQTTQQNKS